MLHVNLSDNGVLMTNSIVCGSINVTFTRIVGSYEDAGSVQSSISASIQAGTSGLNTISSNLISGTSSSSSNTNSIFIGVFVGVGGTIISNLLLI
jgi:hypothetical protein